jgi:hypothetical protein
LILLCALSKEPRAAWELLLNNFLNIWMGLE